VARVTLENLNKTFGETYAVKDVSLTVQDREFMVLVGPSGCGKSTTLRMIAGLEEITSGKIFIADRLVNDLPPRDRDIAMVFQNYALYPHLTVFDNMAFGLRMRKFSKAEIEKRVREAAEILGILDLLRRKPRQLSGGERQRVAVGRAIVRHPQVFLFDEPLSNLDAKLRAQMRVELKRLHDSLQSTVIYVTHDQMEAMTLGDRVVVMKDGNIQQIGEPLEVYSQPRNKFVAGFIGSPAMNFIDASIAEVHGEFYAETTGIRVPVPAERSRRLASYTAQKVTLGIRPEDLREDNPGSSGKVSFETVVEVVEPLGSEILLDVRVGQQLLVARVDSSCRARHHEKIRLAFVPERIHFFDSQTEEAII
jgi:multiple sugar transport system ATP-binding protein